jgi:iron(III) transport system ATP-binding protein
MRIAVDDLTKRFGPVEVVSRATFSIAEGEMFTLLGPSGCGKTTLLRLIAGFYAADGGDIRFGDERVNDVPAHARGIGMVFQNYALWPHMSVFDNVAYGLRLRRTPGAQIRERVEGVLANVRLAGLGERFPGQLSGGQQQRVALARALVLNPKILLLDEPLSNLDAKIRVQVRAEIRKLHKSLGITTIYVTHDQEEALTLSDRIAVFNQGKVLQVGAPKALYERPANRFVADFIGVNNLVEGIVRGVHDGGRVEVETAVGALDGIAGTALATGERCVVCVRPENVALADGEAQPERNAVAGKVAFAAYMGNTLRYDVDVGGVTFKADVRDPWHHRELPVGTPVRLAFSAGATLAIPAQ